MRTILPIVIYHTLYLTVTWKPSSEYTEYQFLYLLLYYTARIYIGFFSVGGLVPLDHLHKYATGHK